MVGAVTTDALAIPLTVRVPALAVIEPRAIMEVLRVTVDILVIPFTIKTPALAVIEPKCAVETNSVGAVMVELLKIP